MLHAVNLRMLISGLTDERRTYLLLLLATIRLLLARLMVQYCFARWRLSSSVEICNTPRPAGLQAALGAQARR